MFIQVGNDGEVGLLGRRAGAAGEEGGAGAGAGETVEACTDWGWIWVGDFVWRLWD